MTPSDFPESSGSHGDTQPQYLTLPTHISEDGTMVTSCWHLSWGDRLRLLWTGRLWLQQLTFGNSLQPQLPHSNKPDELK